MSQLNVTTLKHESAGVDNITLDANGRVGIGTSSPDFNLHVLSTTLPQVKIDYNGTYYTTISNNGALNVVDPGTDNKWVFLRNGTEQMRIDSAGRVTMPYQPAFSASSTYGAAYQTITASAPFPFDGTRINIGGHYNTSTYRFTAPINGLYEFHMNIFYEVGQGASNHDSTFYVNGSQLLTTVAGGTSQCASRSGTDRTTSMLTALIQLSTNDYVEVRARSTSSGGIFGPHSYFSGRLVG